jgi:hypothetical protein
MNNLSIECCLRCLCEQELCLGIGGLRYLYYKFVMGGKVHD